jgi:serine/threonine protein kinase
MTAAELVEPELAIVDDPEDVWELLCVGVVIDGRYQILRSLGHGGMSTVFVARDERLGRDVAFKVLGPHLAHSREVVQRFVNEARTLARLDSPHVVRVLDTGTTHELHDLPLPYMVLELLHGEDLRAHCERAPVPSVTQGVGHMLQACEGLAAAHAAGVIHRDLKPENLFIEQQADGRELVKLLDFGIARSPVSLDGLTEAGATIGSPRYMSPEQLSDASAADVRSDIWSLGVVLYELLAGVPPFRAQSALELCSQILMRKPVRLDRMRPDVPRGLAQVVHRCLELEPERRYADVGELARALAPFAGEGGLDTAQRIERELYSSHAGLVIAPHPAETVDARAPTERASIRDSHVRYLRSARRRRLLARGLFAVSMGCMSALLTQAFAPEFFDNPVGTLTRARAAIIRAGSELTSSAERAWDHERYHER